MQVFITNQNHSNPKLDSSNKGIFYINALVIKNKNKGREFAIYLSKFRVLEPTIFTF